jgi:cytochrome P450
LARIEGQVSLEEMLRRLPDWSLAEVHLAWRANLGLRGLTSLKIRFGSSREVLSEIV